MTTFKIGRYEVSISNKTFQVVANGFEVASGEIQKVMSKYKSCFERSKPDYTKASVCLEYVLEKI